MESIIPPSEMMGRVALHLIVLERHVVVVVVVGIVVGRWWWWWWW